MTVRTFRRRPVEVQAVEWTGDNAAELAEFAGDRWQALEPEDRGDDPDATGSVFDVLHSTWILVRPGQWIMRGVRGEFYPIDPAVLAETYEAV